MDLKGRDFLTLKDFTPEEIEYLVDLAACLKTRKKAGIVERDMRGNGTDAGKFAVSFWRGGRRGNMSPDRAKNQTQHQENANAFM